MGWFGIIFRIRKSLKRGPGYGGVYGALWDTSLSLNMTTGRGFGGVSARGEGIWSAYRKMEG
jgi:hypothetical protein